VVKSKYNIHYKIEKKEKMFNNKKTKAMVSELIGIASLTSRNVKTLQDALEHLGEALQSMHELVLVQEERLQLLEDEKDENRGKDGSN
jgi:predicted RNase H-like HicB family nuclease